MGTFLKIEIMSHSNILQLISQFCRSMLIKDFLIVKVIKPENKYRIIWEVFILAVTIAVFIEIPLSVVFNNSSAGKLLLIEFLISFIYIIDIIVQLNTALVIKMDVITDRQKIAAVYLKKWFWLDLAAAFSFLDITAYPSFFCSRRIYGGFQTFPCS